MWHPKRNCVKTVVQFGSILTRKKELGAGSSLLVEPSEAGRKSWDGRGGEVTERLAHPTLQTIPTAMPADTCILVTANYG